MRASVEKPRPSLKMDKMSQSKEQLCIIETRQLLVRGGICVPNTQLVDVGKRFIWRHV